MVRCHLDGPPEMRSQLLRYVPLHDFELWRHLMETRHGRQVTLDGVSEWVPEESLVEAMADFESEALYPVLRVSFQRAGELAVASPVERFFPVETYPAPTHVDSVVNVAWKGNTLMAPIGGGVHVEPLQALKSENVMQDTEGKVSEWYGKVSLKDLPESQWWWD